MSIVPDDFAVLLPERSGIAPSVYEVFVGLHEQKYTVRARITGYSEVNVAALGGIAWWLESESRVGSLLRIAHIPCCDQAGVYCPLDSELEIVGILFRETAAL